ncbi:hypothetical protein BGW39_010189, partial [Mortierella sp. 14UC]
IWDQQGNRGQIEGPESITSAPPAEAAALPTILPAAFEAEKKNEVATAVAGEADKKATTELKDATEKKDTTEKKDSTDKKTKDADDNNDRSRKVLAHTDPSAITVTDKKDHPSLSPKDSENIVATVDPLLISICIGGSCHPNDDDEDDDEESSGRRRKIHHNQKKFLKQFQGKALKIAGRTGRPIPSRG